MKKYKFTFALHIGYDENGDWNPPVAHVDRYARGCGKLDAMLSAWDTDLPKVITDKPYIWEPYSDDIL